MRSSVFDSLGAVVGVRAGALTAVAVVAGGSLLVGCGDDESAQDRYCAAGDSLQSSLSSLLNLDLVAGGTDALEDAVGQVQDDLDELRDAASDATADEVDALEQSVDDLAGSISDLGGNLSTEGVAAVGDALGNVSSSAQAVLDSLADC